MNKKDAIVIVYRLGQYLNSEPLRQMTQDCRFVFARPERYGRGVYMRMRDGVVVNVMSGNCVNERLRDTISVHRVYGDYVVS